MNCLFSRSFSLIFHFHESTTNMHIYLFVALPLSTFHYFKTLKHNTQERQELIAFFFFSNRKNFWLYLLSFPNERTFLFALLVAYVFTLQL